ncbi:MAG: hypothetical protein AB7J13_03425 [Pyrinomonadaceae bacterium]
MIIKSTLKRLACMTAIGVAFVLISGSLSEVSAQRDPFKKAGWATPKKQRSGSAAKNPVVKKEPVTYSPPTIEARIEYYKRLRAAAMAEGEPLPKVTSVLTLSEMSVTGIFKTPRGYAAMVEATPIKLSYTIYPGEKFFDGQLVAVEENRLVFRKVTKVGEGKFVASVENKPLREFSIKSQIEGTAPAPTSAQPVEIASSPAANQTSKPGSNPFLSPVDEMNQTPDPDPDPKKDTKKPAKVAKNKDQ